MIRRYKNGDYMTDVSVLLGSGGISTPERRELYRKLSSEHFSKCSEVLFIPYASDDWDSYTSRMKELMGEGGPGIVGIQSFPDHQTAVRESEAIYVGGGNSFLLIRELHKRGLVEIIRDAVRAGIPYMGVSAGSNVACPQMSTTNDMPIVHPPSFDSIGIVPFQINPHFHPGKIRFLDGENLVEHFGESRAQRISEFHRHNDTPVLGMWEGSFVLWDGFRGRLFGRATAFLAGSEPFEMDDGSEFDSTLQNPSRNPS